MRVHTDILPDVLVSHTRLPRPFVTQVIRQMKAAGRISAGRPYAPPLTARDIARLVLALSAPSPGSAVGHERDVGRLHRTDGQGEPTAEAEIIALIERASPSGQIAITGAFVEIRSPDLVAYGSLPDGANTFFVIPIAAMQAIAGTLLTKENQNV
ncbi:MAG: hypothetical protein E5Y03_31865 [Mesorhizobium sp.]|uniref:hypothetical protein n=1 Tax=Mesorhizobium sp. TaxID=1871066 RepID=UPI0011F998DB|nr:hypothetical protein [Mesorhizobium sp.]TIN94613.1 MAG: hypothetical protein E5Y03_31865 [Mesorhizobium sp.]